MFIELRNFLAHALVMVSPRALLFKLGREMARPGLKFDRSAALAMAHTYHSRCVESSAPLEATVPSILEDCSPVECLRLNARFLLKFGIPAACILPAAVSKLTHER